MRQDRAELKSELQAIDDEIEVLKTALWPDSYAGGGTVERLASHVQRLCQIIERELA